MTVWENSLAHPECQSLRDCAYQLFDILDDIDTASDHFKYDDEGYREYVERIVKRRFLHAREDRDDLVWIHD